MKRISRFARDRRWSRGASIVAVLSPSFRGRISKIGCLSFLMIPGVAEAQGIVSAVIKEARSGQPVGFVVVELIQEAGPVRRVVGAVRSDTQGKATFEVASGFYRLSARRIGYQLSQSEGFRLDSIPLTVELILREDLQALDSVRIQSSPGGVLFESRRKLNVGGTILTAPELRQKGFSGFREVALSIAGMHLVKGQLRTRAARTSQCGPPAYLRDGVRLRLSEPDIQNIPFEHIKAIEVYQNVASTPAEYAGLSTCGVIVVWTVRPPLE